MTRIITRVIDCWIIRRTPQGLRFLIMKRAPGRIYAGIYHCVHGKILPGETAWKAALREMFEETGQKPVRFWVADFTSSFYEAGEDRMNLVPVFAAEVETEKVQMGPEHESYSWLSLEDAMEKVSWENHQKALNAIARMMQDGFVSKKWLEIQLHES
ncbi:MAG: dihydroneopterin triphosphate diphosphatase [Candidatus Marinimicrobia bacterium]|nr:dihydroneopterin triphosphate diphosphatase [Candidatus Neomarinimicrobiota bacterium]